MNAPHDDFTYGWHILSTFCDLDSLASKLALDASMQNTHSNRQLTRKNPIEVTVLHLLIMLIFL